MKKAISLILALVMCLSLCACSGGKQPESTQSNAATEQTKKAETTTSEETTSEATTVSEESTPELVDGMRPEFKEAMDSYEAFYDEYCEFMTEYKKNPTDTTLLAKYSELMIKVAEMDKAFEEWNEDELNDTELKYYLEVSNHIMQKLVDVAE